MNKKLFFIVFLLCLAASLFAVEGMFAGLSAELNAHTRRGTAIGGGFLLGFDLDSQRSVGLKAGYYNNLDTVSCIEPQALFRYYLSENGGFFIQVEEIGRAHV